MRTLLSRVFLVVGSSLSSLSIYYATPFWPVEFLLRNQLITLWELPCILFITFNIFSLSLIFVSLIAVCLSMFHLGFILPGTLCASWTWVTVSFPMLGKFSAIISSNVFSGPFSLSSPSGNPLMRMLVCSVLSQRFLRLSSFFYSFFLYSVLWQ